jgi:hypothetical protein
MLEDTFEIEMAYIRNKHLRLVNFLKKSFYPAMKGRNQVNIVFFNNYKETLEVTLFKTCSTNE